MEIIPAIDLMNSQVVRLRKGNANEVVPVSRGSSAVEIVERWIDAGASCLHIIDLDRALGFGTNESLVKQLIESTDISIQVGGGLRSRESIENILEHSRVRVILGTAGFREPLLVRELLQEYGADRIVIALDYCDNQVRTEGWKRSTGTEVTASLHEFLALGVTRFLVTSTENDGMLTGPDLETLSNLTNIQGCSISAAGGVRNLEDIRKLRDVGVDSAIVGRSIYEGTLDLHEAILMAGRCD